MITCFHIDISFLHGTAGVFPLLDFCVVIVLNEGSGSTFGLTKNKYIIARHMLLYYLADNILTSKFRNSFFILGYGKMLILQIFNNTHMEIILFCLNVFITSSKILIFC
jgi:hypothetical protein